LDSSDSNKDPKLGLALSGGGARGIFHVGVLQAFEEHDIRPSCVSGTSIGAVVGALYAAGIKPSKMLELLSGKGFLNLFRFKPSLSGFLEMKYLKNVLKEHLPEDFDQLECKLYVCATNLTKGRVRIFDSGDLRKAVLASASIPVVFEPVVIEGDKYVDGGVLNNLPASACVNQCDYLLGIEVNSGKFTTNLKTIKNVALEVFHLVVNRNSFEGMKLCDGLIRPEMEASFDMLDFSKASKLYDLGYENGIHWARDLKHHFNNQSTSIESDPS